MARTRRFLAGSAKDAFLKRLLAAEPGLDESVRARLAKTLQEAIALVATRSPAHVSSPRPPRTGATATLASLGSASSDDAGAARPLPEPSSRPTPEPFDPYSPNVIVVFRTRGRDAALAELQPIDDVECLRLLAREQQLGIAPELVDPCAIRQAIVAAAERRIANRRAAAS